MSTHDLVNHPPHYTGHPSGIECIQITEHMSFCLGNALKYIWRADLKDDAIEDLRKAKWYLQREIDRRERAEDESMTRPTFVCIPDTETVRDPNPSCPRSELHAHAPAGYLAWYEWSEAMHAKGRRQSRCPGCDLYLIWT